MSALRRRLVALASVALLTTTLAACGSDDDSSDGAGGSRVTVRIAYQEIPNADLVVKDRKLLEQALPDADVKWVKFDSGGDVNTAVIAGSVDIGLAGSSPVTSGLSAPLDIPYKVLWIHDVIGDNEALVARGGITDIRQLVGKKVAAPFGSTTHYSLLAALQGAGVEPSKVNIIDLQPQDALAAWKRGDIDAAYVWTPTLGELQKDGTTLITSRQLADQGKRTADLGVVTDKFAKEHPEVVTAWLKVQDEAVKLAKNEPQQAADSIAKQLNLAPADALAQLGQLVLLTAAEQAGPEYLGTPGAPGKLAETLHDTAVFLASQQKIGAAPDTSVFAGALAVEELARAAG